MGDKTDKPKKQFNLHRAIRFWTEQSLTQCGDKGGSFNIDLYLRVLEVRARS